MRISMRMVFIKIARWTMFGTWYQGQRPSLPRPIRGKQLEGALLHTFAKLSMLWIRSSKNFLRVLILTPARQDSGSTKKLFKNN